MRIQLNKVLVFIALLSFIFASYSSEASVSDELKDVQETVKDFISSFSIKDTVENMSPSTIIGLCMAAVIVVPIAPRLYSQTQTTMEHMQTQHEDLHSWWGSGIRDFVNIVEKRVTEQPGRAYGGTRWN